MSNYIESAREILQKKLNLSDEYLLDLYTLLVFTEGVNTSLEHVHDAWSIWKNRIRPDHHSLIPFNELSARVQGLDAKYAKAICQTALEIRGYKTA
jgi:hypothetical protein